MTLLRLLLCLVLPQVLLASEPEPATGIDWLLNGGSYNGEHHSPLYQVNTENVSGLGLDWSLDLPEPNGLAATPIVVDGVIYLSGSSSIVYAVDAGSGEILWRHDPDRQITAANAWTSRVNRGVAVWKDKVLLSISDCRLQALERATGKLAWSVMSCDPEFGYSITDAPRVGAGKVFIGNAGSENGKKNRGYVSAYDVADGSLIWRFYIVPSDKPEENDTPALKMAFETWSGDTLEKSGGGGSAWNEMTYDPESGLLYFGTAGAVPYLHHLRSPEGGDNLFTSSVVAVHAETGEYAWHYQTVPEDNWDYNANMNIVLADQEIHGQMRKTLMIAPKNGFFYVLDRLSGELLSADPFARVNWATHVDLETGRPVLNPDTMFWKKPPGTTLSVWPNFWGAHSTQPMALHPGLGLVYIPVIDVPSVVTAYGDEYSDTVTVFNEVEGKPHVPGKLLAWDPVARAARWSVDHEVAINGGVLTTAGDLVFQGDATGHFSAWHAATGEKLWSVRTGSATTAAPVSYLQGGTQRILIPVGAGGAMQFAYPALHMGRESSGSARLMSFSLQGSHAVPESLQIRKALPELPAITASADQIELGGQLYGEHWCSGCHGNGAVARPGGTVPDLRFASPETQLQWNGIVIGGARQSKGMPAFEMNADEAEAIRQWVISRAWELARQETQAGQSSK